MAKSLSASALAALAPHHPLTRRLIRAVQLRDHAILAADDGHADSAEHGPATTRHAHVAELLLLVAGSIRRATPREEYDEHEQTRICAADGSPIGRLRLPPLGRPDQMHPILAPAVEAHVCGDDGREGDSDAAAECSPEDSAGRRIPQAVLPLHGGHLVAQGLDGDKGLHRSGGDDGIAAGLACLHEGGHGGRVSEGDAGRLAQGLPSAVDEVQALRGGELHAADASTSALAAESRCVTGTPAVLSGHEGARS